MARARPTQASQGFASPAVRDTARMASWTVGLSGAVSALGALLAEHRAGSLAVQALAAEWGAGRLGVSWSDPEAPPPDGRQVAGRAGRGVLFGLGAALFVLAFARLTGATTTSAWMLSPTDLAIGAAVATLAAVRDELLLRGLVLRAFQHTLGARGRLILCGVVAAAARLAEVPSEQLGRLLASPAAGVPLAWTLLSTGLAGACFATLWLRDRGAWMAFGAHAAWCVATTTLISGGACDVRWGGGLWGGGSLEASLAMLTALSVVTAAAVTAWYRAVAGKS